MAQLKHPHKPAKASPKKAMPLQKKLSVNPANDRYEREADAVADKVTAQRGSLPTAAPPTISRLSQPGAQRAPSGNNPSAKSKSIKTTKVEDDEKDKNKKTVQRRADGVSTATQSTESSINRMRVAGGSPLSPNTKSYMEPRFGRSLNNVRVHTGAQANNAAKSVGARAFTVGQDIFFGKGQYQPDAPHGQHLLAHELTHTVQQQGIAGTGQAKTIQREGDDDPEIEEPGLTHAARRSVGSIELNEGAGGVLNIPTLEIPTIKRGIKGASDHPLAPGVPAEGKNSITSGQAFVFKGRTDRGSTTARQRWLNDADTEIKPRLQDVIPNKVLNWDQGAEIDGKKYVRLNSRSASSSSMIIPGTVQELANHELFKLPTWDRDGQINFMDVDHSLELQLGGKDDFDNFWLLDESTNRSSGSKIASRFRSSVDDLLESADDADFWRGSNTSKRPSYETIKAGENSWTINFAGFSNLQVRRQNTNAYWTQQEIKDGDHLEHLKALTEQEVVSEGLAFVQGQVPNFVSIFSSPTGGWRRRLERQGDVWQAANGRDLNDFYKGFNLETIDYRLPTSGAGGEELGSLTGEIFRTSDGEQFLRAERFSLKIIHAPHFGFGGYVDQTEMRRAIRAIEGHVTNASPVTFTEAGISPSGELFANGEITATKALFPNLNIPIRIRGSDIFIEFPIPTDRLNFGPVSVTEASIAMGVGENGIFLEGGAQLEVAQVGSGNIRARVEDGNTIFNGTFDVDMDFLNPAQAEMTYNYNQDELTVSLTAGVEEGRLPGVESGQVTVTISREGVDVGGELQLAGPLSGTVITVDYSEENGLVIGAENIPLPVENVPGVTSATASLFARKNPETNEWVFGGSGTAVLGIAGATGEITIGVEGDQIIFRGNLDVAKGPASGSLSFTATNKPMDEEGNIVEGETSNEILIFGRGEAEITFGPVLKGTAGIELSPDASVTIFGSIGLPPTFEVFEKQEYNKSLLSVETPDFPIWGVSLGGVGIGIFAFADAELSFNAYIGPGQLVDTEVTATMDLDAPEDAEITGNARFFVPAGAGLKLDIGGGLRARLAVAFVEGRVGLDSELGIEADASAGVSVNWNRREGLSVEADVEANARPKFRIGVNASVTAGVDLPWPLPDITKTWGPWRKSLGEFGPDMEMGVKVPVKWNENTGIDFSMEDIEVKQPNFDSKEILKSAFEELV